MDFEKWVWLVISRKSYTTGRLSYNCKLESYKTHFGDQKERQFIKFRYIDRVWSGLLRHSNWGEVFENSLWHFIPPDLKFQSCVPSGRRRDAIISFVDYMCIIYTLALFYTLARPENRYDWTLPNFGNNNFHDKHLLSAEATF